MKNCFFQFSRGNREWIKYHEYIGFSEKLSSKTDIITVIEPIRLWLQDRHDNGYEPYSWPRFTMEWFVIGGVKEKRRISLERILYQTF